MLTRSGLGAAVTALLLAGCGLWWRYEELVVAALGVAIVVLAAIWIAQRPLRASVVRRLGAARVPRGDELTVLYRVTNRSRFRSGRATVIDTCDGAECRVPIESVPARGVEEFSGTLPTRRRGVFPVGPFALERVDPLWLAVGSRYDDAVSHVTVHPRVYQLVGPQGAVRVVESDSALRRASTDPMSGFVSMREYVPGDDPRLIHWPTTARTGTLMVRENVEVRRPEFTVVLDTAERVAGEDDFEEMVDVTATLAVHAIRSGLDVVVRTTSPLHPGRRQPISDEASILDLLTPVGQTAEEDLVGLPALFSRGLDQSAVIMVTGPTGPSSRFADLDRTLVVRIGEDATMTSGVAIVARTAAEFVTRWRTTER